MPPKLTPDEWAQVRYKYEHTDQPVDDICAEHGISPNTLRDRMRRWGWTRRRPPIPADGPPPVPTIEPALPLVPAPPLGMAPSDPAARDGAAGLPAPHAAPSEEVPSDPAAIVPRLQGAVARVLPAIEATLEKLAAGPMPPREMERAGRALSSLTRTLRELNGLLGEQQPRAAYDHDLPEDADAARNELARRVHAFFEAREAEGRAANSDGAEPEAGK